MPPSLNTAHGGLNIRHKVAVVDATRLGPKKTYDLNIPPINIPDPTPVKVRGEACLCGGGAAL